MQKKFKLLLLGIVSSISLISCGQSSNSIPTIYRTHEEWKQRGGIPVYHENKEIKNDFYDHSLAVKCENGTFVGQRLENDHVKTWRGIPFAKVEKRFEKSTQPDPSDKVYEALYFGKVSMQVANDESEPASCYEMGDLDTLTLVIATGNNEIKNKPVFVYVHGGAYTCGGTVDPTYDLRNLAYYYPDVVFVDVTYRLGILGHINLGIKNAQGDYVFSDYEENIEKYNASNNLALLDVVESLRWVKRNISGFGGDINNITLGGESAGGGLASTILMITSDPSNQYVKKEEKLFNKVFSMSGGINQYGKMKDSDVLTNLLIEYCSWKYGEAPTTIEDLQKIPFNDLFQYWTGTDGWDKQPCNLGCGNYLDGVVLPTTINEIYDKYNEFVGDEFTVLQGATANEYDYFRAAFQDYYQDKQITHEDCAKATLKYLTEPTEACPDLVVTEAFLNELNNYFEGLKKDGLDTEAKRLNELLNDHYLQVINYYMAQAQAKNGGKTYCYAFGQPYDGDYSVCKAGHAIDVYYLFGSFNGNKADGTNIEVDFSRKYQEMAVNFIRTGVPSIQGLTWEPYNEDTGYITYLSANRIECVKGYNQQRINSACKMFDENDAMKAALPWGYMFKMAHDLHQK